MKDLLYKLNLMDDSVAVNGHSIPSVHSYYFYTEQGIIMYILPEATETKYCKEAHCSLQHHKAWFVALSRGRFAVQLVTIMHPKNNPIVHS
jgi:hypothetical protein